MIPTATKDYKSPEVIKTLIVLIVYFTYNLIISALLKVIGLTDSVISVFVADIIFLIGIIILYRKDIAQDFKNFNKESKIPKRLLVIAFWVVMIFVVNLVGGLVVGIFTDISPKDSNTSSLYSLSQISFIYTIFKTLIFSTIAEELVFKKSISKIINNKVWFVILSSTFYAIANVLYSDLTAATVWADAFGYFVIYLTTSIMYVKHKDNIFLVMIVKFIYNLIPLAIMLKVLGG